MRPSTAPSVLPSDGPRLRKLSQSLDSTAIKDYSSDVSEYYREILRRQDDSEYPGVSNAASSWYDTIDRLSQKISTQRHELWDARSKLRIEVEKNRDLAKIIRADRNEYREVVAALTTKIQVLEQKIRSLEVELAQAELPMRTTNQFENTHNVPASASASAGPAPQASASVSPAPAAREEQQPDPKLIEIIDKLNAKIDALATENSTLKDTLKQTQERDEQRAEQERIEKQRELEAEQEKERERQRAAELENLKSQWEAEMRISMENMRKTWEAQRELDVEQLRKQYEQQRQAEEELHDRAQTPKLGSPVKESQPPQTPLSPVSPFSNASPVKSKELDRILASNEALNEKLRLQNEEIVLQRARFDDLKGLFEKVLSSQSQQPLKEKAQQHQQPHITKDLALPPSLDSSISASEMDNSMSHSTLSSSSSPRPFQQSSLNYSNRNKDTSSTSATTTSTPSVKLRPVKHKGSANPNIKRLDEIRRLLQDNRLDAVEINRYEELYRNSAQAFAERPQLHADTRRLVDELQRHASLKHSPILSQINEEVC